MKDKNYNYTIGIILILLGIVLMFAIWWGEVNNSRKNIILIETQKEQIATLESKVYHLKNLNGYVLAMEQLLPPLVIMELRMYNEVIRQKKIKIATGGNQKEGKHGK